MTPKVQQKAGVFNIFETPTTTPRRLIRGTKSFLHQAAERTHTFFIGSWYMSSSSNVAIGLGAVDPFPNPGAFLPFPPEGAAFFPLEVILWRCIRHASVTPIKDASFEVIIAYNPL